MAEMKSLTADFGEGEVTVYYKKRTLYEMDQVSQATKYDKFGNVLNKPELVVLTMIYRARTEHGSYMFSASDKIKIMKEFDPDEVARVVLAMNKQAEAEEGN
jgi:predicted component of type VI protein secretion system